MQQVQKMTADAVVVVVPARIVRGVGLRTLVDLVSVDGGLVLRILSDDLHVVVGLPSPPAYVIVASACPVLARAGSARRIPPRADDRVEQGRDGGRVRQMGAVFRAGQARVAQQHPVHEPAEAGFDREYQQRDDDPRQPFQK